MEADNNTADNKAIAEANLTNTIRTGYRVGMLNVQAAQAKKRAIEQGYDISVTREQALGAATANAAAAGTIGSSVAAVASDIESKVGQATNRVADNLDMTELNEGTQLNDILNAGHDVLRSPEKLNIIQPNSPAGFSWSGAFLNAAIDMGEQYLGSKMNLGLGQQGGAAGGASSGAGPWAGADAAGADIGAMA
jgi:hypothetical protein